MSSDSFHDFPICNFVEAVLTEGQTSEKYNASISNEEEISLGLKRKKGKWTEPEDIQLRSLIEKFGEKKWKKISENLPGRSPIQCLHRWDKILKPGRIKGPWTQKEDELLMKWVNDVGANKWSLCSKMIVGRNGKQCRERWINNLDPNINKADWTESEDKLLFECHQKYGPHWSKIAGHLQGRSENGIKNRFYSTIRKLKSGSFRRNLNPESAVSENLLKASEELLNAKSEKSIQVHRKDGEASSILSSEKKRQKGLSGLPFTNVLQEKIFEDTNKSTFGNPLEDKEMNEKERYSELFSFSVEEEIYEENHSSSLLKENQVGFQTIDNLIPEQLAYYFKIEKETDSQLAQLLEHLKNFKGKLGSFV